MERQSVGIEIVSAGQLYKETNGFYFYPLYPNKNPKQLIPTSDVWELKTAWRGYNYYHKYTDNQISSVVNLIKYLVKMFKIPIQPDLTQFYEYNEEVWKKGLSGLWSHSTVITYKTDIVPEFNFLNQLYSLPHTKPIMIKSKKRLEDI